MTPHEIEQTLEAELKEARGGCEVANAYARAVGAYRVMATDLHDMRRTLLLTLAVLDQVSTGSYADPARQAFFAAAQVRQRLGLGRFAVVDGGPKEPQDAA